MKQPRPLVVVVLVMLAVSLAGPADAAAPAGHYVVSGAGSTATVYDTKSKLTWQAGGKLGTWAEGKAYCAGLGSTQGGTGWRMPTFKELMTLLGHWSATLDAKDKSKAWNINFFYGDTYTYGITNTNATRCVR